MEKLFSNNLKKQRTAYKKDFKRMALIEYTKCHNAVEVFKKLGLSIDSNDKKYASKLIYKWKKEFFDSYALIPVGKCGFNEELINYELNSFTS